MLAYIRIYVGAKSEMIGRECLVQKKNRMFGSILFLFFLPYVIYFLVN
jgi:hypothetical protein